MGYRYGSRRLHGNLRASGSPIGSCSMGVYAGHAAGSLWSSPPVKVRRLYAPPQRHSGRLLLWCRKGEDERGWCRSSVLLGRILVSEDVIRWHDRRRLEGAGYA